MKPLPFDLPEPEALDAMPVEQVPAALAVLAAAQTRLAVRLLSEDTQGRRPAPDAAVADDTVTVAEAAKLLRIDPTFIYRNRASLPFVRRIGARALRCSRAGIARYLAQHRP